MFINSFYDNGELHGEYKEYYDDKQLYKHCYYKNGTLRRECFYKNNNLDGNIKEYNENDVLISDNIYKNGKIIHIYV